MTNDHQYIFLSYASRESEFALKLAVDLKNAGINLWVDRLDIKPGEDWRKSLQAGIDSCTAVLAVLSASSIESQYCQRELARADRLGHAIVPILLTPLPNADWPMEIERQQYVDFTRWQDGLNYHQQLVDLINHLKESFDVYFDVVPNAETQYLLQLIATLKNRHNIDTYIKEDIRPEPFSNFQWNLEIGSSNRRRLESYFRVNLLQQHRQSAIEKILENFASQPQLALTGAPGTGKTTLLDYLALQFAYQRLVAADSAPLPVIVRMADWYYDMPFEEFVKLALPFEINPAQTLMLIDGLDEIGAHNVDKIPQIRKWLKSAHQIIVTCRSQPFAKDFDLQGIPTISVYDLSLQQIRSFLNATMTEERASHILERNPCQHFQQALCNPRIMGLLSSVDHEIPMENVGAVMRHMVESLNNQKRHKGLENIVSLSVLEEGLAKLAFEDHIGIPHKDAEVLVGNKAVLETGQRVGFLTISDTHVNFTYPIFRSYFAAVWMHRNGIGWQLVKDRSDFECIIFCLAGISAAPDDIVCGIYQDYPELALHCLVTNVASSTVQTVMSRWLRSDQRPDLSLLPDLTLVIKALTNLMRDDPWPMRQAAYRLLQSLDVAPLSLIEELLKLDVDEQDDAAIALKQVGTRALPTLLKHLHDPDMAVRLNVVWALEELSDRACVPALVEMLSDSALTVAVHAIQALGYQHDSDSLSALVNMLGHSEPTIQHTVFETLRWLHIDTSEALARAFDHADSVVREKAIALLAQNPVPAVTEQLLVATYHTRQDVQLGAIEALKSRESANVIDRLIECLDEKHLHDIALNVLKQFRSPIAHQIVEEATSVVADKGQSATTAKARIKQSITANEPVEEAPVEAPEPQSDILDQLLARLRDSEWGEREETAKALRDYAKTLHGEHVPHILNRLTDLLTDEDWSIRWAVIEPIAWIGHESSAPHLVACLDDDNWTVRVAALRGLQEIASPATLDAIEKRLKDPHEMVREAAIEALGMIGGERMIPTLAKLLDDPDEMLRLAAVQALTYINHKRVRRALEKALNDSDKYVRWVAVCGLHDIADKTTVEALISRLTDEERPHWEDKRICDIAAEVLESIGTDQAKEAVSRWKEDQGDTNA